MNSTPLFEEKVIDLNRRKRPRWLIFLVLAIAAAILFGSRLIGIYIDALWFGSLGYADVYWYKFRLGGILFLTFLVISFLLVRLPFAFLNRLLPELSERPLLKVASVEDLREVNVLPVLYRPGVWILSALAGLISAVSMSQEWPAFALYLNSQPAGSADPIFGLDASFYLFELPVLASVVDWFQTLTVIILIGVSVAAGYVWYLDRMRGILNNDTRRRVVSAISGAGALFAASLAASTFLDRYDLLQERHELFSGMSYTDAKLRLPALNVVVFALIAAALVLLINAFRLRRARLILWPAAGVVAIWLIGVAILPQIVFSTTVKPNELAKEAPFIEHNIRQTREAFGLSGFEERQSYQPSANLSAAQLEASRDTIDNVRLWDRRALKETLSQIQEIRTYYEFNIPDVDRYRINGRLKEVMLAAREMNVDQLPDQSRNWINQHLIYTHGYGVTMNTVNQFTSEGQPNLVLRDMPVRSSAPEIKVERPEIYFGESTKSHVYVKTRSQSQTQPEFNYPAPDNTDSYTTYDGEAGIPVGGIMRRLALSIYLGDGANLLLSDYIDRNSLVLMRREVTGRVGEIAPFLLFENDPYIIVGRDGHLYWMLDGFTTSSRYPYSTPERVSGREINYIRNSVKAIVNAYNGEVTFYVFDPEDPIINAYQHIFPRLFHAADEMPADLREHVRYPSLLLNTQARVYTLYHMQNVSTFYSHEDLWAIATGEQGQQEEAPPMQPYHVLMQLPGEKNSQLEFANILPFTPSGPGKANMIGWIAGRSDGALYGKTLVYTFPKNVLVNGPAQIRARVNQDPQISAQMTLWSQKGSELLRGNLLVIPLADSLLYVEPFYLKSQGTSSSIPELRQVIAATQDRLEAGKTFDEALNKLFPDYAGAIAASNAAPKQGEASKPAAPEKQPTVSEVKPTGEADTLKQARQLLSDYRRLTSEGKYREAGAKLDELNQLLEGKR